ncbi:putative DSBA family oxidoreductase [Aulographum hederae CBS 113979]|uniref:Glutathione S-transferase kappa n=1 Tax=Aulographum hederae CBS 113979 TaxID=1176131 RepID=A0A6G1GTL2_9PEZI|nr:putative DSBA family oxidoreductase [Aulographum hederae CBS 113979]
MGKRIDCYLDCVSPYSYYAFLYLQQNKAALLSHGVEIEYIPVFLGGINVGSGNQPPWKLPAKAAYSPFDNKRAQKYFGVEISTPDFFPILSLLPQRCMTYVKENFPVERYEAIFKELWISMWEQGNDISKPEKMAATLSRHFGSSEVKQIMDGANSPQFKQKLNDSTKRALDAGAFGCPWFEVTDGRGVKEPFFGSDRFHYMWQYLDLPWTDISIREKSKL